MLSTTVLSAEKKFEGCALRCAGAIVALIVVLGFTTPAALAQCSLTSPATWSYGASSNWSTGTNWSSGVAPSGTNVCITDGTSAVILDTNPSVANLQLASGNTLTTESGTELTISGTQVINGGNITINSGSIYTPFLYTYLVLDNTSANGVTLSGAGTLTLSTFGNGGASLIEQGVGGVTLTNQSTIQGTGAIGNGTGLALSNAGAINANMSGATLTLNGTGGITNTGLMEATNGGTLNIAGATVNNAGGNIAAGAGSTVLIYGADIQGGTLTNNGAFLGAPYISDAYLDGSTAAGPVTINGTYTSDIATSTFLLGTITNKGTIQIDSQGAAGTTLNNSSLILGSNVTLNGGGTLNLSSSTVGGGGSDAWIVQAANDLTLTNVDNTIQGEGIIGPHLSVGMTLINESGGTIDANSTGIGMITTLSILGGAVTNHGLMEATNSGELDINGVTVTNTGNITAGAGTTVQINGGSVDNAGGGNITANAGATVEINGSYIQGGTLTNNGAFLGTYAGATTLDGSTASGAVTINGTYTSAVNSQTWLLGTIINNGAIQVDGGGGLGYNTYLVVSGNVTLQGGGTVTLSTASGGGNTIIEQATPGLTLTNVDNIIQGEGVVGYNGLSLINESGGTIDANSTGSGVITTLTISGGTDTNHGLMEATNSGELDINNVTLTNTGNITAGAGTTVVIYSGSVNNQGGTITADTGATVEINGSTIQGGTLTNNGTFLGTYSSATTLDGSTGAGAVTINGTYTSALASQTWLLGTITNHGTMLVDGGSGYNTDLVVGSNVTLQGGGTVTLSTATSGGGNAIVEQATPGLTLTNVDNTIQGSGVLGYNGLTLVNESGAIVNSNVSGGVLNLSGSVITNAGLLEATNGGTLNLPTVTVNNAGGNITAGTGSTVQFYSGTVIQGGTLNGNGAFLGTATGLVYLDGSTASGAITINGTYESVYNSQTWLRGTFINNGNIGVYGGDGYNTYVQVDSNVTLQGGGTVTLSTAAGGGGAFIQPTHGGLTLENVSNTIQGAGIIGVYSLSVTNDAGGTILANAPGQSLVLDGSGTVTNNGTFQANSGSTLQVENASFTNFSGNTLTGGTYNVYGTSGSPGTLQINALGSSGGEIVNNAATILLDGPNSNFWDAGENDALSKLSNNTAAGSFTIQNGRNFASPGDFANAGSVTVGKTSTITIGSGGANTYTQSGAGASLKVDGTVQAITAIINGGTVSGSGTINAAIENNGGNVNLDPSKLTVASYTQGPGGVLTIYIDGTGPGQFSLLDVLGNASLDGNVTFDFGFTPTAGETFTFLTAGDLVSPGVFSSDTFSGFGCATCTLDYNYGSDGSVVLDINGTTSTTPEPSVFLLLAMGIALMTIPRKYRNTARSGAE
jgi:hypothetical protein